MIAARRRRGIRRPIAGCLHDRLVTFRDDAVRALRAGQNADIGDANPYSGQSAAFAKCWQRGYRTMLTIRSAATPAMQRYLTARVRE